MKQVGYYHVFPFQEIEKGSKIILWGMGEVGQHYWKQILQTGYCQVEFAVDKNWQKHKDSLIRVMPIFHVRQASEDVRIVIANGSAETVKEIRKQLRDWGIQDERIVWNDLVIGEAMVVGDKITQEAPKVKRVGYYHIFPFHRVERDERILLWGMGEVGRHYALQLQKTGFAQVEFAVDSKWQGVKNAPVEVRAPRSLSQTEKIRVVIANGSSATVESIRKDLAKFGVGEDRILWEDLIVESELVVQEKPQAQKNGKPYLWGSESGIANQPAQAHLIINLTDYDVVSFNVFDVIILRLLKNRSVFYNLVGEKLGLRNFAYIRTEAEKEAREMMKIRFHTDQVMIEDIYRVIQRKTGIDMRVGCEMEILSEIENSIPNPYFIGVYKTLLSEGKKVIFIEDTLLKREYLQRILFHCGYEVDCESIFTSCDYSTGKYDEGGLYRLVRNQFGKKLKYGHVGHFFKVDVDIARKNKFGGYGYRSANDIGSPYRITAGMSEPVGEAYRQMVNQHLHQDDKIYSVPYEYGYVYGGILAMGFMQWIHNNAQLNSFGKILFLSSDGTVFRDIYKTYSDHVNEKYVYWSEQVNIRMNSYQNCYEFIERMLYSIPWERVSLTIDMYFKMLHIEELMEDIQKYRIHKYQEINQKVACILGIFLSENWDKVLGCFKEEGKMVRDYYKNVIGDAKKIAIVDVNGYGEYGLSLARLITEKWGIDCSIDVFTMGSKNKCHNHQYRQDELIKTHAYCFSKTYQCNLYKTHFMPNDDLVQIVFSMLWKSPNPDFACFFQNENKIGIRFALPCVENYEITSEIKKGILNFCEEYKQRFTENQELMDISGWDAYMPFKGVSSCRGYYKSLFNSYWIVRNISDDWMDMDLLMNRI